VIVLEVRWYLRYGLSYRDVEELLVERGVQVDHVSIYRWVQRFTPLLIDAARPRRHATGDRCWSSTPITRSESDHGRLKSRLQPMRGLKRLRSTRVISAGHAFIQNLRRGHYELGMDDIDPRHRLPAAFAELALAI
jgi:transposase-like protein